MSDFPSDSYVLNAKLALKLAGDGKPAVAKLEASNARVAKFTPRPYPVMGFSPSLSKQGYAHPPDRCV